MVQQESGKVTGTWKLAKVTKAEPSTRDGVVRQVELQYKNPGSKSYMTVVRAVQRIVVISPVEHDEEYDEYIQNSLNSKQ